jgi:hypothetical protein
MIKKFDGFKAGDLLVYEAPEDEDVFDNDIYIIFWCSATSLLTLVSVADACVAGSVVHSALRSGDHEILPSEMKTLLEAEDDATGV